MHSLKNIIHISLYSIIISIILHIFMINTTKYHGHFIHKIIFVCIIILCVAIITYHLNYYEQKNINRYPWIIKHIIHKNNNNDDICIICFENKTNIILKECNHDLFCDDCISKIENINNKCPLCRQNIYQIWHNLE